MAEQLKQLIRPDHKELQRLIGLLTDGSSTVSKVNKVQYLETLTAYQQRVVAQLDAPNPEQAKEIERLSQQILQLWEQAAEDHPREIEEITRRAEGEAENVRLLQLQMKGNQAAAMEVARLPHDQAAAKLEEARRAHDAIEEDTPENNVQKAVLTYKMDLLEAKQAEHEAIQKSLLAERRAGAEEALRSPELALERQSEIFRAQREQMAMDAYILTALQDGFHYIRAQIKTDCKKLTASRAELVDVESQGVEVQLRALELDRQVAQLENQLQMLETLRITLEGFLEVNVGIYGLRDTELYRAIAAVLDIEREEHQRLVALNKDGTIDYKVVAKQAKKVTATAMQFEALRSAVEEHKKEAAKQLVINQQFLRRLLTIVPKTVPAEEKLKFIWDAVKEIIDTKAVEEIIDTKIEIDY